MKQNSGHIISAKFLDCSRKWTTTTFYSLYTGTWLLLFPIFALRKLLLQLGLTEEVSNVIYDIYDKYHGKILEHMEATGSYTTIDFIGNAFIIWILIWWNLVKCDDLNCRKPYYFYYDYCYYYYYHPFQFTRIFHFDLILHDFSLYFS